jgi:hypothetical protein
LYSTAEWFNMLITKKTFTPTNQPYTETEQSNER